jgi:hypothetical protein
MAQELIEMGIHRLVEEIAMLFEGDQGRSRKIKMLKKYCELDNIVQGQLEHYVDLLSRMRKVPVYFLSTTCEVDISLPLPKLLLLPMTTCPAPLLIFLGLPLL